VVVGLVEEAKLAVTRVRAAVAKLDPCTFRVQGLSERITLEHQAIWGPDQNQSVTCTSAGAAAGAVGTVQAAIKKITDHFSDLRRKLLSELEAREKDMIAKASEYGQAQANALSGQLDTTSLYVEENCGLSFRVRDVLENKPTWVLEHESAVCKEISDQIEKAKANSLSQLVTSRDVKFDASGDGTIVPAAIGFGSSGFSFGASQQPLQSPFGCGSASSAPGNSAPAFGAIPVFRGGFAAVRGSFGGAANSIAAADPTPSDNSAGMSESRCQSTPSELQNTYVTEPDAASAPTDSVALDYSESEASHSRPATSDVAAPTQDFRPSSAAVGSALPTSTDNSRPATSEAAANTFQHLNEHQCTHNLPTTAGDATTTAGTTDADGTWQPVASSEKAATGDWRSDEHYAALQADREKEFLELLCEPLEDLSSDVKTEVMGTLADTLHDRVNQAMDGYNPANLADYDDTIVNVLQADSMVEQMETICLQLLKDNK